MAEREWKFCLIGGLAVQKWGEPRSTVDVDFTLLTGWGNESDYIDPLLSGFPSRIGDAGAFALKHRVLLLATTHGVPIDIALGALPFEERMVENAIPVTFGPSVTLPCCTAEDLVVMKAFAGRPRDWFDIETIVARQTTLNRDYIVQQVAELAQLKEDPTLTARVKQLLGESP